MVSSAVNDSLVGRELDARYRVLSRLADGGMATVYVALDTRLDREIALKVMRPHLADDEAFVSRFRREARSAARLSHPNVVAVYDQGEDAGQMFLAMEYVPGHTLRQVLSDEGALTPRAALDILDSMLQALAAAHRAGIVHRDVKPENVILREDGVVKVADFGLARAVTSQTNSTSTGMILGTVAYLSPEQVERSIADVRSDVYAAGLVLFEMLTGEKALTGETPIQIAYQHVHGSVPAPSSRVSSVPPALDALVASATAREPDLRPADADAYLDQVRRTRSQLTAAELDRRPQVPPNGGRVATGELSRTAALPLGQQPSAAVPVAAAFVVAPPGQTQRQPHEAGSDGPDGTLPTGRSRRGWPALAVGLLLLAAVLAWYFLAGPGASTLVPNVVGKTASVAKTQLEAAHLSVDPAEAFNEKVPKGIVISTDPAGGREVGRRTEVTMTVSLGPERYAVPSLIGHSRAEAESMLKQAKLAVGSVSEDYSEKVTVGLVMATTPVEGKLLKPGTAVKIVVSKGREPIEVQDFTGKPADQAIAWITDAGFKVKAENQEWSDSVPKGSVISQDPTSGIRYRGDTVTLVVSKGPQLVTVPNVVSRNENEAKKILEDAGFKVKIERFMGGIFGTVRSQDPPGDSQQPEGTTVTLIVV